MSKKQLKASAMNTSFWTYFCGAVQSVALSQLGLVFLKFTCRFLLINHYRASQCGEIYASDNIGCLLFHIPLAIPLKFLSICLVIVALLIAKFRSCKDVVLFFGIINSILCLLFMLIMLFCKFPIITELSQ